MSLVKITPVFVLIRIVINKNTRLGLGQKILLSSQLADATGLKYTDQKGDTRRNDQVASLRLVDDLLVVTGLVKTLASPWLNWLV